MLLEKKHYMRDGTSRFFLLLPFILLSLFFPAALLMRTCIMGRRAGCRWGKYPVPDMVMVSVIAGRFPRTIWKCGKKHGIFCDFGENFWKKVNLDLSHWHTKNKYFSCRKLNINRKRKIFLIQNFWNFEKIFPEKKVTLNWNFHILEMRNFKPLDLRTVCPSVSGTMSLRFSFHSALNCSRIP